VYLVDVTGTAKVEYFPGDLEDDSENPDRLNVKDCKLRLEFFGTDGSKMDMTPVDLSGEQHFYTFFSETDPVIREIARQVVEGKKLPSRKPRRKYVTKSQPEVTGLDDDTDVDIDHDDDSDVVSD